MAGLESLRAAVQHAAAHEATPPSSAPETLSALRSALRVSEAPEMSLADRLARAMAVQDSLAAVAADTPTPVRAESPTRTRTTSRIGPDGSLVEAPPFGPTSPRIPPSSAELKDKLSKMVDPMQSASQPSATPAQQPVAQQKASDWLPSTTVDGNLPTIKLDCFFYMQDGPKTLGRRHATIMNL